MILVARGRGNYGDVTELSGVPGPPNPVPVPAPQAPLSAPPSSPTSPVFASCDLTPAAQLDLARRLPIPELESQRDQPSPAPSLAGARRSSLPRDLATDRRWDPRRLKTPMAAPAEPCAGEGVSAPPSRPPLLFQAWFGCRSLGLRHWGFLDLGSKEIYSSPLTAAGWTPFTNPAPLTAQLCLRGHQTSQLLGALTLICVKLVGAPSPPTPREPYLSGFFFHRS